MANPIDPELPSIFVNQALLSPDTRWKQSDWPAARWDRQTALSAALKAAIPIERIGTSEGVEAKCPYVVWSVRDDPTGAVRTAKAKAGELARKKAIVLVKRVDQFLSGKGSFSPARSTYQSLFEALIGLPSTPIYGADGLLGTVTQTRWRRDVRSSAVDKDSSALVTQMGFEFEILYENN